MALPHQKAREVVLQLLFALTEADNDQDALVRFLSAELAMSKTHVRAALTRAEELCYRLEEIDSLIAAALVGYSLDRIQNVEKTILRLLTFELIITGSLPLQIAMAEAGRLANKFSTPSAASLVGGILTTLYDQRTAQSPERPQEELL